MIDVIVTTYNRYELLKRTLNSFAENTNHDLIGQVIVSNDGSTDETARYLESKRDIIVLPDQEQRKGIIPRFNEALTYCTADIICEFQDDVEFSWGWLEELVKYVDRYDFVTGFDAPEHVVFGKRHPGLLKTSSRFTQLMAKREVWDRYFPMESFYPFPTPTRVDGKCIGSKIDLALSGGRINRPRGKTRFYVVPGLVRHTAEHFNSTWRSHEEQVRTGGGLTPDGAKSYWENRYRRQRSLAVGYGGRPEGEQKRILQTKKKFILDRIDTNLRTIDYGCGIGLFSQCFRPDRYIGIDLTPGFLKEALETNPGYWYTLTEKPNFDPSTIWTRFDPEMFFTTNVLQHNCNYTVARIFKSVSEIKPKDLTFVLYENTDSKKNTRHMCFRSPDAYVSFIAEHFSVRSIDVYHHEVHREQHSLIVVNV